MERIGEVTAVVGDELEITFCRPADCGKCHACGGGRAQMQLRLKGKAQVGDAAVVDLPDGTLRKASVLAYVLPLIGLLAGVAIGGACFPGKDGAAALIGLAGLLIASAPAALGEKKRRENPAWQPALRQILPREDGAGQTDMKGA